MARRAALVGLTLCLWVSAARGGWAQARDEEFRVNAYTTGAQDDVAVAMGEDGAAVVVWESGGQDGSGDGILLRSTGVLLLPLLRRERLVNTYTSGSQDDPAVAVGADGSFLVVWESTSQDGSGEGVFGRRISRMGFPLGAEFVLNTHTSGNQDAPAAAALAGGGFVVAWESLGQDGDGEGVMARVLDGSGRGGPELRVNDASAGDQYEPSVAGEASGGFVVVWSSSSTGSPDASGAAVLGRRFAADGGALGPEFLANTTTTGDQAHATVASLTEGGFVVVWASYGQDGSGFGIFGQAFGADGMALGQEFQANTYTSGTQLWPAVAAHPAGGFVVVWESAGQDGSSDAVVLRRFSAWGEPQGPEQVANRFTSGAQEDAAIACGAEGACWVTWESADGSSDGVVARRLPPGTLDR